MSERLDRAEEFLNESWEHIADNHMTPEDFEKQLLDVEADMVAGIQEEVRLGWLTEEQADILIREWKQRYGR